MAKKYYWVVKKESEGYSYQLNKRIKINGYYSKTAQSKIIASGDGFETYESALESCMETLRKIDPEYAEYIMGLERAQLSKKEKKEEEAKFLVWLSSLTYKEIAEIVQAKSAGYTRIRTILKEKLEDLCKDAFFRAWKDVYSLNNVESFAAHVATLAANKEIGVSWRVRFNKALAGDFDDVRLIVPQQVQDAVNRFVDYLKSLPQSLVSLSTKDSFYQYDINRSEFHFQIGYDTVHELKLISTLLNMSRSSGGVVIRILRDDKPYGVINNNNKEVLIYETDLLMFYVNKEGIFPISADKARELHCTDIETGEPLVPENGVNFIEHSETYLFT